MNVPPYIVGTPTQAHRRYTYETGSGKRAPLAGNTSVMVIPAANAFESIALVAQAQCVLEVVELVLSVDATAATNFYVLAYDLPSANAGIQNAIGAGTVGAARYTWGPLQAGSTLVREPLEAMRLPCGETVLGYPFDQGCVLALSTTPGVMTAVASSWLRVAARVAEWW